MSEIRRSRRSTIDRIARGLLVLFVIAAAAWLLLGWLARARLESAQRAFESNGGALELEEFLAPAVEEGTNASEVLDLASELASWSAKKSDPPFDWREVSVESLRDPSVGSRTEAQLSSPAMRLSLELIDSLDGTESARYFPAPGRTIDTVGLYSNDRSGALYAARAIRSRAFIAASEGRINAAYEDVARILKVSLWMYEECPGIVPWLLANAVVEIGLDGLEQVIATYPPPDGESREVIEDSLNRITGFRSSGLRSELAVSIAMSEARRGREPRSIGLANDLWSGPTVRRFAELIAYAEEPPATRGSWPTGDDAGPAATMWRRVVHGPVAEFVIPNLLSSIERADVLALRIEMARVALEAAPDESTVLPIDPFNGEPLRWGGPEGCTVYSVGPNKVDDGGVRRRKGSADGYDVAWTFPCWVRDSNN